MGTERVVIPYSPREHQRVLHEIDKRWFFTVCHRRFGKTVYAVNKLIRKNFENTLPDPRYAYIAPYQKQAKAIAWDYLKHYSRPIPGIKINESELRIDYPNNGRIRLYGADNPDALRGIYLDGVELDEYAQMPPSLFSEVIRPALSDRHGWAEFMGTPKGKNHFWDLYQSIKDLPDWAVNVFKASETGIVAPDELESARQIMTQDEYDQEYECSWTAAVQGAIYGDQLRKAEEEGRITAVPIETAVPVNTFWDLGRNDTTAIWFHQRVGLENRFIDYYESRLVGLDHYGKILKDKGYTYGEHYLPHDVEIRELSTNRSRKETLEGLGVTPIITVPRIQSVNEGIEQTRQAFPSAWFDKDRCAEGLKALQNYQYQYDEKYQVFRQTPLHNWASNGADAFRQYGQGYSGEQEDWGELNYPRLGTI